MRYEETPDLFGIGYGSSTFAEVTCEFCGHIYNAGCDGENNLGIDSVIVTNFAGKQVCECCFEKIEEEILGRMSEIIPWYKRILDKRAKENEEAMKAFEETCKVFDEVKR